MAASSICTPAILYSTSSRRPALGTNAHMRQAVADHPSCSSQKPIEESSSKPSSPSYDHEHISSFTHRSTLFGGEEGVLKAESEWAQSEVGEGVEEVQERTVSYPLFAKGTADEQWMTAGRWITTLAPSCTPKSPKGEEVAAFFHGLSLLHGRFPTAKLLADADVSHLKERGCCVECRSPLRQIRAIL